MCLRDVCFFSSGQSKLQTNYVYVCVWVLHVAMFRYWALYLDDENGNGPAERPPRATVFSPG